MEPDTVVLRKRHGVVRGKGSDGNSENEVWAMASGGSPGVIPP